MKYLMFDFDGTIIDSMPFLTENAVFLLTKYYHFSPKQALKCYRETTGLPFIQQMELIAHEKTQLNEFVVNEFERLKLDRIFKQRPFPESHKVLEELRQRGYKLGISSGTIESIITNYLEIEGLDLVDDILGWRPGFEKGKDHFDYVNSKYNMKNSEIVFIGDSINDAKRALSNKVYFIAKIGMFQKEEFQQIIPKVKAILSLTEILNFFPSIHK